VVVQTIIGYILRGRDNKTSKFIGDVFILTGINTVGLLATNKLIGNQASQKTNSSSNWQKNWEIVENAIPIIVSMIAPGIIPMMGLGAIPLGGFLMVGGNYVPGLLGKILFSAGSSILNGGIVSRGLTIFTKKIGYSAAKLIARNNRKITKFPKFLINVGKITSLGQKIYKDYGNCYNYLKLFNIFKNMS
jgi:hypothetical protein